MPFISVNQIWGLLNVCNFLHQFLPKLYKFALDCLLDDGTAAMSETGVVREGGAWDTCDMPISTHLLYADKQSTLYTLHRIKRSSGYKMW